MTAPLWAQELVEQVAHDYGRRPPELNWRVRRSDGEDSRGSSSGSYDFEDRIVNITAGTWLFDQRITLLHEMAHFLHRQKRKGVKRLHHHNTRFWEIAWELYFAYANNLVPYAYVREDFVTCQKVFDEQYTQRWAEEAGDSTDMKDVVIALAARAMAQALDKDPAKVDELFIKAG